MAAISARISGWMGPQAHGAIQRSGLTPHKVGRNIFDVVTSFFQNDVNSYFTDLFAKFKPKNISKNTNFSKGNLDPSQHHQLGFFAWNPRFYLPRFFAFHFLEQTSLFRWKSYTDIPNKT